MTFPLKTSHKAVKDYYAALEKYRNLGYKHEGAVRSAFAELMRTVGKKLHYTLVEECKVQRNGAHLFVDGAHRRFQARPRLLGSERLAGRPRP